MTPRWAMSRKTFRKLGVKLPRVPLPPPSKVVPDKRKKDPKHKKESGVGPLDVSPVVPSPSVDVEALEKLILDIEHMSQTGDVDDLARWMAAIIPNRLRALLPPERSETP